MKAASLVLVGILALVGSTAVQAAFSPAAQSHDVTGASAASASVILAKHGADNPPGDDHGGKGGGKDDGAHHH